MLLVMSLSLVAMPASLFADDADDAAREKISQEGEAAAAASANIKPTAQMIIDKVTKASGLLTEKGQDAFASFKGKDSEFIFAGTYIWIHDMEGVMLMHPIKYKMEGKRLIGLKDKKGKLFFAEMNKIAREKGQGWVSYLWPKPGETESSLKVSFVKLCKMKDGTEVVIGCGVYDMAEEEVVKLTGE
ncbi:MAG: cache domain-containing protein [Sedimentisphaerales bacterium]|nr:cache domain-containing protein [Sedimentisphaerales bacterium]